MTQYDNLNTYSKNEQKILERNKGEKYEKCRITEVVRMRKS